jgi:hypothetical protein
MAFWKASDAPAFGAMSRAGLGICALAALLAALAPAFGELVEGPDRQGRGIRTATFDDGFVVVLIVCTVVLVGVVLTPRLWAQFTGIVIATIVVFGSGSQVAVPRLSKDFRAEADLILLGGAKTLVVAATIGMAGLIVTLVGVRREPPIPLTEASLTTGGEKTASRAVVALIVALAGVLLGVLPPLAIALGVMALAEIQRSEGRLRGQGIAVAAIAIGIVTFSLYISLTAFGMLAAVPPA